MSELKNLIPPLELCKLIPQGEFKDSAFVWALRKAEPPYIGRAIGVNMGSVIDGDYCLCTREYAGKVRWVHGKDNIPCPTVPAPTLQEIMAVLPHDDAYNDLLISYSEKVDKLTGWHIYYSGDRKRHCYDQSAVTAALKLWLTLKGIEA